MKSDWNNMINNNNTKWFKWYRILIISLEDTGYQEQIYTLCSIFVRKCIEQLIEKFESYWSISWFQQQIQLFRWVKIEQIRRNELSFKLVFGKSLKKYVEYYGLDVNVDDINIHGLWKLIYKHPVKNSNIFWDDIYTTMFNSPLIKVVDHYRSLSCSIVDCERSHKIKNQLALRNYGDKGLKIYLFLYYNTPRINDIEYWSLIKDAVKVSKLLRYVKYRNAIKELFYGGNGIIN